MTEIGLQITDANMKKLEVLRLYFRIKGISKMSITRLINATIHDSVKLSTQEIYEQTMKRKNKKNTKNKYDSYRINLKNQRILEETRKELMELYDVQPTNSDIVNAFIEKFIRKGMNYIIKYLKKDQLI